MSDLEQLARETRSSIELTRNAKSDYQWVIKIYYADGEQGVALQEIIQADEKLRFRYIPEATGVHS